MSTTIRWARSDGNENWASYNGYVNDRVRFHIVGERFGSHVDVWGMYDFQTKRSLDDQPRLKDAKKIAQTIIERESTTTHTGAHNV